jgi:hypothetical protein
LTAFLVVLPLTDNFEDFMSTYRIYARWPENKVSDKTVTESKAVADFAWNQLQAWAWPENAKPLGLTFTCNGKQLGYVDLSSGKTS